MNQVNHTATADRGALHLALCRIGLGLYLMILYARLTPWAGLIYSDAGVLPDPALNPTAAFLPEWLYAWSSPFGVQALTIGLSALGLLLAVGLRTRTVAVLLWAGQTLLWHRDVFTLNPSMPFVGLLLLSITLWPSPTAWSLDRALSRRPGPSPAMPRDLVRVLWIVMAAAYSYSGITKLASPGWVSGEALGHVLSGPLARPSAWVAWVADQPWITHALTWGTLAVELLFAPLCLIKRLRPWVWAGLVAMHVGILATVGFAELTLGMLVVHLFTLPQFMLSRRAAPHRALNPLRPAEEAQCSPTSAASIARASNRRTPSSTSMSPAPSPR